MNLVGCIPRFIKTHGGWIFTILSSFGVIGTGVLVAEEAPVVKEALRAATDEKGAPLTFGEKFEIAAPIYLPAFLVGGGTIGCMFGAQIFNDRQKAALVAAYALLGSEFNEYRKQVREVVGEEKEKEIWIESRKKIKELQEENRRLRLESGPHLYGIATAPGLIFDAKPEHMQKVFHHMLFNMLNGMDITMKDLYDHIGLPKNTYKAEEAVEYGWSSYENEVSWGQPATEFEITDIQREDGKTVHIIGMNIPPYLLNKDYGRRDSSVDYLFEGYDWERTLFLAQASTDEDVEHFEQPDIWIQHLW